jgi:hypothetical protein
MADSRLELVAAVDTDRANAFIKSVNASLSTMEVDDGGLRRCRRRPE